MNGIVTVRINVLGIGLNDNQVDAVLENENNAFDTERDWLRSFFQLDSPSELIRGVLIRYAEADGAMARISVGTNQEEIYPRLISTLVSAKRCYANAEYLACIELCALHGEMLANYLCITEKEKLDHVLDRLAIKDKKSINDTKTSSIYFSDGLNQKLRLKWLVKAGVISIDDKAALIEIHELRIKYFHHWSPERSDDKQDAVRAISKVSPVTAKFLEILNSRPNLERVEKYMKIVSGDT